MSSTLRAYTESNEENILFRRDTCGYFTYDRESTLEIVSIDTKGKTWLNNSCIYLSKAFGSWRASDGTSVFGYLTPVKM